MNACLILVSMQVQAQIDSIPHCSKRIERIAGTSVFSAGKIRGFNLGDSICTILRSEKAILEAQGNDFLYYRVLCDSVLSAEISYTFNEKGLLISIEIDFFESCKHQSFEYLSEEFLMQLQRSYTNCVKDGTDVFQCESETGMHIDYQKQKNEICVIHTQIEFY